MGSSNEGHRDEECVECRTALVIGGGLAGIAAAVVLAERGVKVTLIERETFLGGRAGAWEDRLADGTPFQMERGFHAFFRQYYNLRALLRRVDPTLSFLAPMQDYPLLGPNGARESFKDLPRTTPLNIIELVRRSPAITLVDLTRVSAARAAAMLAFDPERTPERWDRMNAAEYLDSLGFPAHARRMLFDVFAHSFFNPEPEYSAAELLAMFHFYFLGNPEGLVFDCCTEPFSTAFVEPLTRYLEERGVEIVRGTSVDQIEHAPDARFVAYAGGRRFEAAHCVLAVSVPTLRAIVSASPDLLHAEARRDVLAQGTTLPFAVWRLWLDRKVRADRAPFAGTTGLGLIDNISVFEKLEGESRAWSERTGGSVIELHAYAVPRDRDEAAIKADLLRGLHALYPETRDARVIEERFLLREDCPAFPPGGHARRPGVVTDTPGLYLAGDYVKLPFASALMERATSSGFIAANAIVRGLGEREEPVRRPPTHGLFTRPTLSAAIAQLRR